MGYNVVLKKGAKDVLNFWVGCFSAAECAIFTHLKDNRINQGTILDVNTGDLRRYSWLGDKLNVSLL